MADLARSKIAAAGWWLAIAFLILRGSTGFAEVVPGDDFNADNEAAAAALQGWYKTNGIWDTTGWWNAANCVEALEDVCVANNGQKYQDVLETTFRLNSSTNFINEYYDGRWRGFARTT